MQGTRLRTIGDRGTEDGTLSGPQSVAFDRAGNLLVCDTGNKRVQVLTPHGEVITAFKTTPEPNCVGCSVDLESTTVQVFAFAV